MNEFFLSAVEKIQKKLQKKAVILLSGPLGAGKTEFVKTFVRLVHGNDKALSPTYALHHHYAGEPTIEHWDLYRLHNEDELESSGFWDQFSANAGIIIVEWPERLKVEWLPNDWQLVKIHIQVDGEARKIIEL
jgi:tRNA threonylcarbamoyladenosine biosynthesis protein TsaE